ncbi:dimethyl sulfoxide reductase anchor subunit family protein [Actinomyces israelii]|uniref:dimethyl sulfoxide reductase anchor subunit family protein n=1 Tax=Actinomyces israelii TaxID=1659 RepID=UPI0025560355|nr:DmsC/YnfH family molybdoenzyme membrane anchor subunit [Actinomyces israelii]WKR22873.1 hypothetical protein AIF0345_2830 [Actinomyces israelii]
MRTEELPMILFTVIAQMSVGAFWVLGAVHLFAHLRGTRPQTVDRVSTAAMFAVGPLLVLGFVAAFFHLGDPFHALNTLRHLGSSWLSRELAGGTAFGTLGMVFAACEWFGLLSRRLRAVLAALTAAAGLALVVSMCGVYQSVRTIPAWHTPATSVFFVASTLLTGSLAVGVALLATWTLMARRRLPGGERLAPLWARLHLDASEPLTAEVTALTTRVLRGITLLAALSGIVIMVAYPLHLLTLSNGSPAARVVAGHYLGPVLTVRLILLAAVVVAAGIFAHVRARTSERPSPALSWMLTGTLLAAAVSEMLGRALHYEGLVRDGLNTVQYTLG